jgi:hypothetical protein
MKTKQQNENFIAGMMAVGKYPDLSGLTDAEKSKAIKDFVEVTSRYFLQLFLMLGLKTHIETMIVNERTGKEYILSFKTVEKFQSDHITTDDLKDLDQQREDYYNRNKLCERK